MSVHVVDECEICGPIVARPAYADGVDRAAAVMLDPEGSMAALNLVESLAPAERKDVDA